MAKAKTEYRSKTAFIRAQPPAMPAAEVQKLAAKAGIKVSTAYIYNVRSTTSRIVRERLSAGRKVIKGDKKTKERAFSELVLDLGPARCRKLLEQVETKLLQ